MDGLAKLPVDLHIIHLEDFPPLTTVATLFSHLDVLITPHGNGLGNAIFMNATTSLVISVNARLSGGDPWFEPIMHDMGMKFISWTCDRDECVMTNAKLLRECQWKCSCRLSIDESDAILHLRSPKQLEKPNALATQCVKCVLSCYTRDVERKLNVDDLTMLVSSYASERHPQII